MGSWIQVYSRYKKIDGMAWGLSWNLYGSLHHLAVVPQLFSCKPVTCWTQGHVLLSHSDLDLIWGSCTKSRRTYSSLCASNHKVFGRVLKSEWNVTDCALQCRKAPRTFNKLHTLKPSWKLGQATVLRIHPGSLPPEQRHADHATWPGKVWGIPTPSTRDIKGAVQNSSHTW